MSRTKIVKLGAVARITRNSVAPEKITDGTLYVGLENIERGGRLVDVREVAAGELKSAKFSFTQRDLLFGKLRPNLGKVARPNFGGICSTDILPLTPGPDLNREYLAHYLSQDVVVALAASRAKGANLPRLSPSDLAQFELPLPPLEEQQRIAEVLDRAAALRAKRGAASILLDDLTRSIFFEYFGDATNPRLWPVVTLEEIADQITDGEHLTPLRSPEGVKLLSARNVRQGRLDFDDVDFVPEVEYRRISRRCNPVRGDVLISCSGSIGRVAVVDVDEPLALVRSVALVRPRRSEVTTDYLAAYLSTASMQAVMKRLANASSQANLFQGPIRTLRILLPPMELQLAFDRALKQVAEVRGRLERYGSVASDLLGSLQQRAFAGGSEMISAAVEPEGSA